MSSRVQPDLRVDRLPSAAATVRLRPGVAVVRRDAGHRQVGLDDLAVVVADDPATASALDRLATGEALPGSGIEPVLRRRLTERGLLVDAGTLDRLLPPDPAGREAVAAAFAAHGPPAAVRLAARRAACVEVIGPPDDQAAARRLLASAGLAVRTDRRRRRVLPGATLLLASGEPSRGELDDAVREGRPHLVVAAVQGRVRIGPFVVPGVTACLRCLDAHRAEADPRRSLVVEQQARDRGPDQGGPVDPVLGALALALAVRDLVAWAEGERPTTWSATVEVTGTSDLVPRPWAMHPYCGCAWGARLPVD